MSMAPAVALDKNRKNKKVQIFEAHLRKNVIGQFEAVDKIVEMYQLMVAGLYAKNKPLGNLLMLGPTGTGKAQPLDAQIATPDGFISMGDVTVGSLVMGPNGAPQKVLGVYPQGLKDIYRVTFKDGRTVECCEDHLWQVYHKHWEPRPSYRVLPLREIKRKFDAAKNSAELYVPLTEPLLYNERPLPVAPYLMGVLLGDGGLSQPSSITVTSKDLEMLTRIAIFLPLPLKVRRHRTGSAIDYNLVKPRGTGLKGNPLVTLLRELGLSGTKSNNKFVPSVYRFASYPDRLELLKGLLDTDGTVGKKNGSVSFCSVSEQLAKDVQELVWSVGGIARISKKQTNFTHNGVKKNGQVAYIVNIRHPHAGRLFTIQRKIDRCVKNYQYRDSLRLQIVGIQHVGQKPAQCIKVENPDGLYLTDSYVVTHNTHICETVAQCLFGDPQALIKVDCAEFQHSHEVAKLIGSPPGYLGHRETHPIFTMDNLYKYTTGDAPIALVLFDEIEKASDSLWQLLLGILDKATLTLGDNRKTDFSRTLIFFTSNLGAKEMSKLLFDRQIGFQDASREGMKDKLTNVATNAAKQKFSPEFMNRIDRTVVFNSLKPEHLKQILEIELKGLQKRVSVAPNGAAVSFTFSDELKQKLLDEGYEPQYGARHLKRALERNLINPIAAMMSTGQVMPGDTVHCRLEAGEIEFLSDRLPVYSAKDRQTWEEIC